MTSHHDVAGLCERLRVNTCRYADETEEAAAKRRIATDLAAADLLESQATALSEAEQSKRGGFAFWKNIARIFSQRAKSERDKRLAAEARLADKEAELSIARQINHDLTDGITGTLQKDKIESLEARLAEAMKHIDELTADLGEEIEGRYAGIKLYPSEARRYARDIATVVAARAFTNAAKEKT